MKVKYKGNATSILIKGNYYSVVNGYIEVPDNVIQYLPKSVFEVEKEIVQPKKPTKTKKNQKKTDTNSEDTTEEITEDNSSDISQKKGD